PPSVDQLVTSNCGVPDAASGGASRSYMSDVAPVPLPFQVGIHAAPSMYVASLWPFHRPGSCQLRWTYDTCVPRTCTTSRPSMSARTVTVAVAGVAGAGAGGARCGADSAEPLAATSSAAAPSASALPRPIARAV